MGSYTKPIIKSTTVWGGVLATLPLIINEFPAIAEQVAILNPSTAAVIGAVSGIWVIFRRIFSANKTIAGIFS